MLMRCLKKVFGAALVLSAVLSLASIARAQTICNDSGPPYPCTDSTGCKFSPGDIVPCNLTVPSGATCHLPGVTVTGSIFVEPTGCLVVGGSKPATVGGNINSTDAKCLSIGFGSTVAGSVIVNGTTGDTGGSYDFVCNSSIGGSLEIESSGTGAFWCIGAKTSPCTCAKGNDITGSLTFNDNQGGGTISDNTIGGNLECSNNSPAPTDGGVKNNVTGTKSGQCSTF